MSDGSYKEKPREFMGLQKEVSETPASSHLSRVAGQEH